MRTIRTMLCALALTGCGMTYEPAEDAGPQPCLVEDGGAPAPSSSLTSWASCSFLERAALPLPDDDGNPIPGGCLVECPWPTALGPGECPYEAHGTCVATLCDAEAVEACYRTAVRENTCGRFQAALEECQAEACR